jgi:hypothetical protein
MSDIDPVDYGRLCQTVDTLVHQVQQLTLTVNQLNSYAERGKGGFYVALAVASGIGGVVSWLFQKVLIK